MTQTQKVLLGSRDAYLARHWSIYRASVDEGLTVAELKERFQVSTRTVNHACARWGHQPTGYGGPKPWQKRDAPNERGLAVLAHLRLGWTHRAVANKYGITRSAVGKLAQQWPQYCVPAVDNVEDVG